MRSRAGFFAAIIFLSSIPAALIIQNIFGEGAETVLHFAFAAGSALLGKASFDFHTPLPVQIAAAAVTPSLALIFFLQGLSAVSQSGSFNYLAFDLLGQLPERLLIDLLMLWFVAILSWDSEGHTKLLGIITVGLAIAIEVYNYWLNYNGTTLDAEFAILKITLLVPFVWLLIESKGIRSR
jgi:hypothetical protein